MEITFIEEDKKVVITNCEFEFVQLEHNGEFFADIPIKDGIGEFTNSDSLIKGNEITAYPYNAIKITLGVENEVSDNTDTVITDSL